MTKLEVAAIKAAAEAAGNSYLTWATVSASLAKDVASCEHYLDYDDTEAALFAYHKARLAVRFTRAALKYTGKVVDW